MKRVLLFVAMTIALTGCKKENEEIKIVPQPKQEVTQGQKEETQGQKEEKTSPLYGKWQFEKYEEFIGGQKQPDDTSEDAKCTLEDVLTLTETKYSLTSHSYDESTKKCKSNGASEYDYQLKDNTIKIGLAVYEFEVKDDKLTLTIVTKDGVKEVKIIRYYKKIN